MNYWITTDTHFDHDKMFTKFKTREEGFEKKILKGFQAIRDGDLLIHLGDVSFGNDAVWNEKISEINCIRWLLKGNHDKRSTNWYLNHGWNFVADTFTMRLMGHKILFSHIPQKFTGDNYTINIHGHFHDNDHRYYEPELVAIRDKRQHLLALETNNYQLFNLKNILKDFDKKMKEYE